jgi:hypothetical protein
MVMGETQFVEMQNGQPSIDLVVLHDQKVRQGLIC